MIKIDKNNLLLDISAVNKEDAIKQIINQMVKNQYVEAKYIDDVLEREESYPTGLPTDDVFTALPHASSEFVHKTGIGIARLTSEVDFLCMGDSERALGVKLVFVLASPKEDNSHLDCLQDLMQCFTRVNLLNDLMQAKTTDEFATIIENMESYEEA